jgi:hypothetical protein
MLSKRGITLCVSSQAGCGMACVFCATGTLGLARNLKADEIVAQVVHMLETNDWQDPGFNVVFMGMGEPLANYAPDDEGDPRAQCRGRPARRRAPHHGLDLRDGAADAPPGEGGPAARPRDLAARHDRRPARPPGADQPALSPARARARRGVLRRDNRPPRHARVHPARRRQRPEGRRRAPRRHGELAALQDQPHPYNPVPQLPWQRPTDEAIQRFADWLFPAARP